MQFSNKIRNFKVAKDSYDLVRRKVDKDLKVAPAVKAEFNKQMPRFKSVLDTM